MRDDLEKRYTNELNEYKIKHREAVYKIDTINSQAIYYQTIAEQTAEELASKLPAGEGVAKAREKGREIKAQMKVEAFLRNEFGGARGIERFDAASYEDSLN